MALSYKSRRRLSLLVLLFGLPAYIAAAWWVMSLFDRPPVWVEFAVYVLLGVLWALPLKAVFKGVGQADPDATPDND
jgi:membrane protein implicated in regulation of membrane protease activity